LATVPIAIGICELHGETPNTILAGATINHQKFNHQKQQAKTNRLADNKTFAGCAELICA
jgi:hypothetical protein